MFNVHVNFEPTTVYGISTMTLNGKSTKFSATENVGQTQKLFSTAEVPLITFNVHVNFEPTTVYSISTMTLNGKSTKFTQPENLSQGHKFLAPLSSSHHV